MRPVSTSRHRQQMHRLQSDAWQAVRRYFEKHERSIRNLDQAEFLDLLVLYLDAVFECGEYHLFRERVDEAILMVVDGDGFTRHDERVFHHLLYRKAAAAFHTGDTGNCRHILMELLRLEPAHPLAARFLVRAGIRRLSSWRQSVRALAIGFFLATVLVLMVEILGIRPFRPGWVPIVEGLRNGLFLAGWVVLVGGETGIRMKAWLEVRRFRAGLTGHRRHRRKNDPVWP